jgi:hypothetical protein
MKKMININLGGRIITIENKALQIHLAYIETLHCYFINEEGHFEIINDIENRMAELMLEIINKQKATINETNMENIIQVMGTADEIKDMDADDWDIPIPSPEQYNISNGISSIRSSYNLNGNTSSYLEGSKLCYN